MTIIGIDLGTTNSLVSYWKDNKACIIPNALGEQLTPSVVSVDDDGEVIVGRIAKERLISHPTQTVQTFKRYMGSEKILKLGNYKFLPEELSSFVIRSLKEDAKNYLKEPIEEAIISVPAYFNDAQRRATKRAGELAGLKVQRLINEPTAAAIAYGLDQRDSESKFLVLDLGGGTFDVSILELYESIMEVQAVAGDNYLGGEDFTKELMDAFMKQHGLKKDLLDEKAYTSIQKGAEQCKKALSENKVVTMAAMVKEEKLDWKISNVEFERLTTSLLNRLRLPIQRALKDASIPIKDLDAAILVGGATRMPIIRKLMGKLIGRLPLCSINPDEVVALGAGIQGGMKERAGFLKEVILTDVCPYTLGTEISIRTGSDEHYEAGHFFPIIERNTVIPTSKVKRLYTIYDQQKKIKVNVFQGESRLTKNNVYLGELNIDIPKDLAGNQAVDIRYTYDVNGILEVEAVVVHTGEKKRLIIEQNKGSMSREEIDKRFKALENIKIHPRDQQKNRLLIARGERLYEETLGDLREEIALAIARFESILDIQNDEQIHIEAKRLESLLDEIEGDWEY